MRRFDLQVIGLGSAGSTAQCIATADSALTSRPPATFLLAVCTPRARPDLHSSMTARVERLDYIQTASLLVGGTAASVSSICILLSSQLQLPSALHSSLVGAAGGQRRLARRCFCAAEQRLRLPADADVHPATVVGSVLQPAPLPGYNPHKRQHTS